HALAGACLVATTAFGAAAAQSPDEQAVKAANDAYYAALSGRSSSRIEQVWAHDTKVTNIFAAKAAPTIGWNRVKGAYENLFTRFTKLSVTMPEPVIRVAGDAALIVGVEVQEAELPNGSAVAAKLPATNVFLKEGNQWLMVHHHSSRPPS